jgi:hypothetical protein
MSCSELSPKSQRPGPIIDQHEPNNLLLPNINFIKIHSRDLLPLVISKITIKLDSCAMHFYQDGLRRLCAVDFNLAFEDAGLVGLEKDGDCPGLAGGHCQALNFGLEFVALAGEIDLAVSLALVAEGQLLGIRL